jgi:HEAT repeat protein
MALVRAPQNLNEPREETRARAELLLDLQDADPSKRRWAARDLLGCSDVSAQLVARLKTEPDLSVREVVLTSLTRIGDKHAVNGLVECLRSEDAALRNEAIEAMQSLPQAVGPLMKGLLKDADSDLRIFAVNILESLRHPEVETWLIEVLETDTHVNVCATAVDLLAEVGTSAARKALLALKDRFGDEPYIQFAADLSLRRIDAH